MKLITGLICLAVFLILLSTSAFAINTPIGRLRRITPEGVIHGRAVDMSRISDYKNITQRKRPQENLRRCILTYLSEGKWDQLRQSLLKILQDKLI